MKRKWIFITVGVAAISAWAWSVYVSLHDVHDLQDEAVALAHLIAGSDVYDLEDVLRMHGVRAATIIDENMRVVASSGASADVKVASDVRNALSSDKILVDSEDKGLVRVTVPRVRGGGVQLEMRPPRRAPRMWGSVLMYLIAAFLIGYAARTKKSMHAAVPAQESAPPSLSDRCALDVACVERMMGCSLVMVDEGRRVVASGERGAALLRIDGAHMPHLIDLVDADDVQAILSLVRCAPQGDGARVRVHLRGRQYECAALAVNTMAVLTFRELEDAL